MTDLDPFCALGGADGAAALFRTAGGCWLRAASMLTRGMRMRRSDNTPCQCAAPDCTATASVLCCCEPSAGTSGIERRCPEHCSGSATCVQLKGGPLYNRWVFDPNRLMTAGGMHRGTLIRDWKSMLRSFQQDDFFISKSVETLRINGSFKSKQWADLVIKSPVHIVGEGGEQVSLSHFDGCSMDVMASLVMLENISYCLSCNESVTCCCRNCSEVDPSPAIKVRKGAHLIAHICTFYSDSGAAVKLEEGSKATLHGCTIVSRGRCTGNSTGVTVKTGAQLAMYDCEVVNETFEFAFAREYAPAVLQLADHNAFINEAIKHPKENPEYDCHCELECQCGGVIMCGCEHLGGHEYECECDYSCRSDCKTCPCVLKWERMHAEGPVEVKEYANTVVQPWRADWPCQAGHALACRK